MTDLRTADVYRSSSSKQPKKRKVLLLLATSVALVFLILGVAGVFRSSEEESSTTQMISDKQNKISINDTQTSRKFPDKPASDNPASDNLPDDKNPIPDVTESPKIVAEARYRFKDSNFDWKNIDNWEWADGSPMTDASSLFSSAGIRVDRSIRHTSFRTRRGFAGRKVVYVEWIANAQSDTNIWMINMKISPQYGINNGWPYYGEIDLFEMFNADALLHPHYDFSGFKQFKDVASYGQLTFHVGKEDHCFCPASPFKDRWYRDQNPLTSSCTAQFANRPHLLNRLATIFDSNEHGQFIQLIQDPEIVYGADNTVDVVAGSKSVVTPKIWNTKDTFWGIPAAECNGGHNPATGFPFFESFRLILEEQMTGGMFDVKQIKVLLPA